MGRSHTLAMYTWGLFCVAMACQPPSAAMPTSVPQASQTATTPDEPNAAPTATTAQRAKGSGDSDLPKASLSVEVPDTPAGTQLSWLLTAINERGGLFSDQEAVEHFHQVMRDALPGPALAAQFSAAAQQLAPLQLREVVHSEPLQLMVRVQSGDAFRRLVVVVDEVEGTLTGVAFQPDQDPLAGAPTTWEQAEAQLAEVAPNAQYLIAQLPKRDGEACTPLHSRHADASLAIGSTFKLYVLSALAEQIETGRARWDEMLAVQDSKKSLPSGKLQAAAAGTEVSLKEMATLMISISDNTATDHLLHHVGRQRVQAAVAATGHQQPLRNVPFLSTREMFTLKLDPKAPTEAYSLASSDERPALLDGLSPNLPPLANAESWNAPRYIDTIEWFASSSDLCRAMKHLQTQSEQAGGETLLEVLSVNPGLPRLTKRFPYVGFKGGSEPGVLNLTWLLRTEADRWYVASFGFNNPKGLVEEARALPIAWGMLELLAKADAAH